jgi:hypothetical protein
MQVIAMAFHHLKIGVFGGFLLEFAVLVEIGVLVCPAG